MPPTSARGSRGLSTAVFLGTVTVNGAAGHNRGGSRREAIPRKDTRQDCWLHSNTYVLGVCAFQATPGVVKGVAL